MVTDSSDAVSHWTTDPVRLPFGTGTVSIALPGRGPLRTLGVDCPPPLADLPAGVVRSLDAPKGCAALETLIPAAGRIVVLVSDPTRGRTAVAVLGQVLEYLSAHGAGPRRVAIALATGMHRSLDFSEIGRHFGSIAARGYRILQHDARDKSGLASRGKTVAGTPCSFLREAAEASLVIGVGTVTFHYFAGFGGGRKLILPGIAGEQTILANHRLSLGSGPIHRSLAEGCRSANLDGNPVHTDMVEGARLLGPPVFMVNVVAGRSGAPAFVNAGEMTASHLEATSFLAACFAVRLDRRFRLVMASAGGHPHDINLLQTHKAIRHASAAVADGGLLLLAAACPEGIGSPSYKEAFADGREGVPAAVGRSYTLNAQAAVSTWEMTGRIGIRLASLMAPEELRRFGFETWEPAHTADLAADLPDEEILIMPHASAFLPVAPI